MGELKKSGDGEERLGEWKAGKELRHHCGGGQEQGGGRRHQQRGSGNSDPTLSGVALGSDSHNRRS